MTIELPEVVEQHVAARLPGSIATAAVTHQTPSIAARQDGSRLATFSTSTTLVSSSSLVPDTFPFNDLQGRQHARYHTQEPKMTLRDHANSARKEARLGVASQHFLGQENAESFLRVQLGRLVDESQGQKVSLNLAAAQKLR
jgi:hypothetical protein